MLSPLVLLLALQIENIWRQALLIFFFFAWMFGQLPCPSPVIHHKSELLAKMSGSDRVRGGSCEVSEGKVSESCWDAVN